MTPAAAVDVATPAAVVRGGAVGGGAAATVPHVARVAQLTASERDDKVLADMEVIDDSALPPVAPPPLTHSFLVPEVRGDVSTSPSSLRLGEGSAVSTAAVTVCNHRCLLSLLLASPPLSLTPSPPSLSSLSRIEALLVAMSLCVTSGSADSRNGASYLHAGMVVQEHVGDLLTVWRFVSSFAEPLGLDRVHLDALDCAFTWDGAPDSPNAPQHNALLSAIHIALVSTVRRVASRTPRRACVVRASCVYSTLNRASPTSPCVLSVASLCFCSCGC
jgi:hypothetical protein